MKLNQRTKGTTFPASALNSGGPNNILPPSKTVAMPNTTEKIPAAGAHLGRLDSLPVMRKLRADPMFADIQSICKFERSCSPFDWGDLFRETRTKAI